MASSKRAERHELLIVDDKETLRRLLSLLLRSAGFEVEAPETAAEALQVLARSPIEAVVLDLNMAEMSGEQFHESARALGYRGPFLVLSADKDGASRARALGAAYLAKPFDPDDVLEALQRLAVAESGSVSGDLF